MRTRMNIYEMSERELKSYKRALRLRIERRKKACVSALAVLATVCMILICAVSYHSIRTDASSGFKYYRSITVQYGETLWDLADEYMDYDHYVDKKSFIVEVAHINHLDESGAIRAGQRLVIPYFSDEYVE